MKINIYFPSILKMEIRTAIEVETIDSLISVKEKVFNACWDCLGKIIPKHGSAQQVILRDRNGKEITNDFELRNKIEESSNFSAVFDGQGHH